jgi:DNA-binding CsgD family transcriptional regulator
MFSNFHPKLTKELYFGSNKMDNLGTFSKIIYYIHLINNYGPTMSTSINNSCFNRAYQVSFSNPSEKDLDIILKDSVINAKKIQFIYSLFFSSKLHSIDFFRVTPEFHYSYIGMSTRKDLKDYFISGLWKQDLCYHPCSRQKLRIVDYSNHLIIKNKIDIQNTMSNTIVIATERKFTINKDVIMFTLEKNSVNVETIDSIIPLYDALTAMIELIYETMYFSVKFTGVPNEIHEIKNTPKPVLYSRTSHQICQKFNLSKIDLDYLSLVSSGCSIKSMAIQLNKSYRYLENKIQNLCKRLKVDNKTQLEKVAIILLSQIYSDFMEFDV